MSLFIICLIPTFCMVFHDIDINVKINNHCRWHVGTFTSHPDKLWINNDNHWKVMTESQHQSCAQECEVCWAGCVGHITPTPTYQVLRSEELVGDKLGTSEPETLVSELDCRRLLTPADGQIHAQFLPYNPIVSESNEWINLGERFGELIMQNMAHRNAS